MSATMHDAIGGGAQQAVMPLQRRGGIDIGRRADLVRDQLQRHALGMEGAVLQVEMVQLTAGRSGRRQRRSGWTGRRR